MLVLSFIFAAAIVLMNFTHLTHTLLTYLYQHLLLMIESLLQFFEHERCPAFVVYSSGFSNCHSQTEADPQRLRWGSATVFWS